MFYNHTSNGIPYKEELAGPNGMSYILFPSATDTKEMITVAKSELRRQKDVVRLKVADDYDLDYNYTEDIFRHPATMPLQWFEINVDEELIRKERLKGTTPDQFVELFVLPCVDETRAKNQAKYPRDFVK